MTAKRRMRGLTLVEVGISSALLIILAGVLFSSLMGTTDTVETASAITDTQLEAERVARLISEELQRSGVASPGDLTVTTGAQTLADDTVDYTAVSRETPLFNPADPWTVPYEGVARRIVMESDGSEILGNGIDDDGDFIVDEGRVVLYQGGNQVAVLGVNIARLEFELVAGQGTSGLPVLKVMVRVDRLNRAAVRGAGDFATALRSHTSTSVFTLLN